jgi:hypothetical protein
MLRAVLLILAGSAALIAHDPVTTSLTWSQEISRIILKRCGACHREGGNAMSLMTYEEVRPWSKAIRDEVLNRRMPPWGAIKGFGDIRNDASLTQEEITRIAQWVEGGAPEGDPIYLPERRPAETPSQPKLSGIRLRQLPVRGAQLLGIRPLEDVSNSKLTAHLPDGRVEPLLWLMQYQKKWDRTFERREPLSLPAGTRIVSVPAVKYELLVSRKLRPKPIRDQRSGL